MRRPVSATVFMIALLWCACALAPPAAQPPMRQYMKVEMEQDFFAVRSEPGDFGPEIGVLQPGECIATTGQAMERAGGSWLEVSSPRGWYDRTARKSYATGWAPSGILVTDPGCEQAQSLAQALHRALAPGLDSAAAAACSAPGAKEAFAQFALNQPGFIRIMARTLDNSVLYVTSGSDSKSVKGIRTPEELILELTNVPASLYLDCGKDPGQQLLDAFEIWDIHGQTPSRDRLKVTLHTGAGEELTFIYKRDIFRMIGVVDRGWKITEVTRLPRRGE